jgi:site-specific DNA-methyltransferase (adenine-specific)
LSHAAIVVRRFWLRRSFDAVTTASIGIGDSSFNRLLKLAKALVELEQSIRFLVGDALTVLKTLPDHSVDAVVGSPAFLALRDYLPKGHPDKALEMGSEANPGLFLDHLLDVIEELARVLAPHGSLCLELGDTYSGSGGAGGDYGAEGLRAGQPQFDGSGRRGAKRIRAEGYSESIPARRVGSTAYSVKNGGPGWPLAKSLCMIPEITRFALAYGFNPLTGRETPRWRVRNVVRWCKPSPPVGALADKFRPATSEILIACKGPKRYFDQDAVRVPASGNTHRRIASSGESRFDLPSQTRDGNWATFPQNDEANPAGAPLLDHWWQDVFDQDAWLIPSKGYTGAHYATFTKALIKPLIEAMCPQRVCLTCGKPSERITRPTEEHQKFLSHDMYKRTQEERATRGRNSPTKGSVTATYEILGWSDCGCDNWRRGLVLDPFVGSGTTLAVASGLGRSAIGIDLDERNLELARERVGMFLDG